MALDTADQAALKRDRAEYIERMTLELGRMATVAGLPVLAFILDMAAQEAALAKQSNKLALKPTNEPGRRPRTVLNRS